MKLPKPYLSYSSINLFLTNKEEFRNRYYLNIKSPENKFSLFGKEVHKALESGQFPHIPRYKKSEFPISVDILGIKVLGYLDSFEPSRKAFLDFKTGTYKPDGSPRWTELEVQKSLQLPFYSLLLQQKFGTVQNLCKLVWLITRSKKKFIEFEGHQLESESDELELTGEFKVFNRRIEQFERDTIRELIVKTAQEISEDYQNYVLNTFSKNT